MEHEAQTPRLMRLPEVVHTTGLGRSAIYERMHRGEFPQSVEVTPKARGWVESEVLDWVRARIARRAAA